MVAGVEARWRTRTGAPLTVRLFGYGVDDDRGEGYEVAVVDVTALRAAEDAAVAQRAIAEQHAAALRMLVDQVPAFISMFNRELRVISAQGSGLAEVGLTPERAVGRLLTDLGGVGPAVIAHARAVLAGRSADFEAVVSDRTLALSMAPVREGDEIVGAVSVGVDVTHARRLEARVHAARRAESLGLLAGRVAHDFNNLLVAMLGNADLALLDLATGSSARVAVESIRTAALRAAELTGQLLAVAGRNAVAMAPIDVGAVVDEMVTLLRPTFAPAITVDVALAVDLPRVRADATQLREVVLNLLTNARDAVSAAGRIEITAAAVEHDGEPADLDVDHAGRRQLRPGPGHRRRGRDRRRRFVRACSSRSSRPSPTATASAWPPCSAWSAATAAACAWRARPTAAPRSRRGGRSRRRRSASRDCAHPGRRRRADGARGGLPHARRRRLPHGGGGRRRGGAGPGPPTRGRARRRDPRPHDARSRRPRDPGRAPRAPALPAGDRVQRPRPRPPRRSPTSRGSCPSRSGSSSWCR